MEGACMNKNGVIGNRVLNRLIILLIVVLLSMLIIKKERKHTIELYEGDKFEAEEEHNSCYCMSFYRWELSVFHERIHP